jgi:hypothetical protein
MRQHGHHQVPAFDKSWPPKERQTRRKIPRDASMADSSFHGPLAYEPDHFQVHVYTLAK